MKISKLWSRDSEGDGEFIGAVCDHIERWIGEPETALHELKSPFVHVDVHLIRATPIMPYHVCVTTGLAERPMKAGPAHPGGLSTELIMCLPGNLAFEHINSSNETKLPIAFLRLLARYPHAAKTWIWDGQTIGIPEEYMAPTYPFVAGLLTKPYLFEPSNASIEFKNRRIYFHQLAFLTQAELDYKQKHGSDAFLDLVEDEDRLIELLIYNPDRASMV